MKLLGKLTVTFLKDDKILEWYIINKQLKNFLAFVPNYLKLVFSVDYVQDWEKIRIIDRATLNII